MKFMVLGLIGLLVVGCGGSDNSEDGGPDSTVTAPVVCVDDAGAVYSKFSVPGKTLYQMMKNTYIETCSNGGDNTCSVYLQDRIQFTTTGEAIAGLTLCLNKKTGDTIPGATWVYQE